MCIRDRHERALQKGSLSMWLPLYQMKKMRGQMQAQQTALRQTSRRKSKGYLQDTTKQQEAKDWCCCG
eukprot:9628799-Prorocentrum_lima.AAC.1